MTARAIAFEQPPTEQDGSFTKPGKLRLDALADRPVHIVAIDDEPSAIAVLKAACEIAGFNLSYANDPRKGLELVREQEPDVVLLDVMMPEVNGFDVCAQLKNDPDTQLIRHRGRLRRLRIQTLRSPGIDHAGALPGSPAAFDGGLGRRGEDPGQHRQERGGQG